MDLMASSAVNFPMINASLRLVVIWTGGSILCTKAGARLPRLTFTTNFMFFKISPIRSESETRLASSVPQLNVFVRVVWLLIRCRIFCVWFIRRLRRRLLGVGQIFWPWHGWLLGTLRVGRRPQLRRRGFAGFACLRCKLIEHGSLLGIRMEYDPAIVYLLAAADCWVSTSLP